MTTITSQPRLPISSLPQRAWEINKPLTALFVFCTATLVLSFVGLFLDPRATAILNTPAWAKTFKFSLSLVLYAPALVWALSLTTARTRRTANIAGSAVGSILLFEMVLLVIQGARARPMHFNYTSLFDLILWQTMTVGIFTMLIGYIVLVIAVWRGLSTQPVLAWGVRLGLLVTLAGLLQGMTMPGPTPAQLEAMQSGAKAVMIGAHTVGSSSLTPDNGPGLPLLGWSTTHGDLRIGHFVGLHALQIIPLFALWLTRRRETWLTRGHRLTLLWTGAIGYFGLVVLVTWQALRAQPLLAPDAVTLTALAALVGAVVASSVVTLLHARSAARQLETM
jgi:hypothetical protein